MPARCVGPGGQSAPGPLGGGGGAQSSLALFAGLPSPEEGAVALPKPTVGEDLLADYDGLGTTLGPHPLALLRGELKARRCRSSKELLAVEHGRPVSVAGLVDWTAATRHRQRRDLRHPGRRVRQRQRGGLA